MKTTLKDIRNISAVDITRWSSEDIYSLYDKEQGFNSLAYSVGVYGVNGVIVQGRTTNTLYKVTTRSTALFQVL